MNRKQLILILVALVIIGGGGLLMHNRNKQTWTETPGKQGQKLFASFSMNDVAVIHLKGAYEMNQAQVVYDVNLVKKDDVWGVQERDNFPANYSTISDFLMKMNDLKISQSEPIGQSQLARMNLDEPGPGRKSILVEFKDNKGAVLQSLLVGKKYVRKPEEAQSRYGMEGMADGRYVMLRNDPKNMLLVPDALAPADEKAPHWVVKDFFKIEKPKTVSFQSTESSNSWKISRETETNNWILADAKADEIVDQDKASANVAGLVTGFLDVSTNATLDQPQVTTVDTFDHFHYVIKAGGKNAEGNGYLSYDVSADFPKERVPGKDEKPEDKAKLDQEFKDKTKALEEKLAKEKNLSKWTYVMAKWGLDAFRHDRAQFLAEKKEEKPATPAPTAPAK